MNNDINEKIVHAAPVPPFVRFVASAVPMVFDNSLSYYEALCALWKWMQDNLVDVINHNATVTEQYIDYDLHTRELFIELKSYVDNYFDNLDVQEEINNKLDQMADDGTLQEIITAYIQANVTWTFDTVADMKLAENLSNGSYAQTLGFYSVGDGGGAMYKILNTGTANEMNIIAIGSLKAHLVTSEANPLQFGAYGDNTNDDTAALQACFDYAHTNNIPIVVPAKTYLTDSLTITEVKKVKIDGIINLSSAAQNLNVLESVQDYACDIYINRVNTGSIIMKGLNTADVRIQRAYRLTLLADNTTNHGWIAYSKFYLGFINELNILDDGSGTKYINENIFIGGRFARINIGTGDSNYRHENNLFLKPLCEDTVLVADYARANIFQDARFEGSTSSITWGEHSFANVVYQEWRATNQGYWMDKEYVNDNITVTDNSFGRNAIHSNRGLNENVITNINITNNPRSMLTDGDMLYPLQGRIIYQSDLFPLPDAESVLVVSSDETHYQVRVYCYDENKELITTDPNLAGDLSSPAVTWSSSAHRYNNTAYVYSSYLFFMKPSDSVKYVQFEIFSIESGTRYQFKNLKVTLNSYANISPEILDMAKKYTLAS